MVPASTRACSGASRSRVPPRTTRSGLSPDPSPESHHPIAALRTRPPRYPVVVLSGVFRSACASNRPRRPQGDVSQRWAVSPTTPRSVGARRWGCPRARQFCCVRAAVAQSWKRGRKCCLPGFRGSRLRLPDHCGREVKPSTQFTTHDGCTLHAAVVVIACWANEHDEARFFPSVRHAFTLSRSRRPQTRWAALRSERGASDHCGERFDLLKGAPNENYWWTVALNTWSRCWGF